MGGGKRRIGADWPIWLGLAAAALLPVLIYALITLANGYRDQRRAVEAATLDRSARIIESVEARLESVSATLRVLATIRAIGERDWPGARERAGEIAELDPDWRGVALVDLDAGAELFDTRRPFGAPRAVSAGTLGDVAGLDTPRYSGIRRGNDGRYEIEARIGVFERGRPRFLLRVALDPRFAQQVLMRFAPKDGVSAVVDRQGLFIARSKAWPKRLGGPATIYVRRAIRAGRSGIYSGVTYEGLTSYTAFTASPRTGWSSHVAVSSALIDAPSRGSRVSTGLAGIAAVALALSILLAVLRMMRAQQTVRTRVEQAERLEAVGKLSGGVAHDFNNMLAIVIGSLDLAQRRLAAGNGDIVRYIDNAMEGANRAADLTRRLLAFSRRQPLEPAAVDVNALIEGMAELMRRAVAETVAIRMDLATDLWPVFVDAGQLENALVNLAINARDAMPDGGTLTVSTARRTVGSGDANLAPGDYVTVAVADDGTGMPPEVAARAFEPFFTTKEVGRGTGLGLSQIHGFATQSGGGATIRSTPGVGTTVELQLPRHAGAAPPTRAVDPLGTPAGRAEEVILLVEDDEGVRRTNAEALRALGYTVRTADGGAAALQILATQPGVRLVVTDIVMPGMTGRDLAARVAQTYPAIPVLMVSGYDNEADADGDPAILRKPFGVDTLGRRVRAELDRSD